MSTTASPFSRPLYLMAKPVGSACNLACRYCYYLEKGERCPSTTQAGRMPSMSDQLLERFIREYIEAQTTDTVLFTWHGGEPLMQPLNFYRKALRLQRQYARGRHVDNCIQTNGTLITEEWCSFFKQHGFLVGISIDGPQAMHDSFRLTRGGSPSFSRVMRGIALLEKHGVDWNALATVNSVNVHHPVEFYRFFKDIGCRFLQFTPIVERTATDGASLLAGTEQGGKVLPFSVEPKAWGRFLCAVFDEWVKHDVGQMFVQLFDTTLAAWAGVPGSLCTMSDHCGAAGVIEANGDVYACDHFVFPEYLLGNLHQHSITELMYSDRQRQFGRMKREQQPQQCRECDFLFACNGECPRNRFINDRYGQPHLNYLCKGYAQFFHHVAPYMDFMFGELRAGRPPAGVMNWQAPH